MVIDGSKMQHLKRHRRLDLSWRARLYYFARRKK